MDDYLSATAFARELTRLEEPAHPIHALTIGRAVRAGRIPGAEDRGPGMRPRYRLPRSALDYVLENLRCSSDGCNELAPGPSRRCGEHPARVKYPNERRRCERCGRDLGPIPGSRIREGRGKYCEYCWPDVRNAQWAKLAPTANPDGARKHFALIRQDVSELADQIDVDQAAAELFRSRSRVEDLCLQGLLPSSLQHFRGSVRRLVDRDGIDRFNDEWANAPTWRQHRLPAVTEPYVNRLRGRGVIARMAEKTGLTMDQAEAVYRAQAQMRRSILMSYRRGGRTPLLGLRAQLLQIYDEVYAEEVQDRPGALLILNELTGGAVREIPEIGAEAVPNRRYAAVAIRHYQRHPEAWPYNPSDRGCRAKAIARVYFLIDAEVKARFRA